MRRASVGERESERTSYTYKSNATSVVASQGGERKKKITPIKTRQFETLDINKIKKQK